MHNHAGGVTSGCKGSQRSRQCGRRPLTSVGVEGSPDVDLSAQKGGSGA